MSRRLLGYSYEPSPFYIEKRWLKFIAIGRLYSNFHVVQICKYLANRLSDLLLSPDLKAVSTGALDQFDLDVIQCELFTSQCPVAGLEVGYFHWPKRGWLGGDIPVPLLKCILIWRLPPYQKWCGNFSSLSFTMWQLRQLYKILPCSSVFSVT